MQFRDRTPHPWCRIRQPSGGTAELPGGRPPGARPRRCQIFRRGGAPTPGLPCEHETVRLGDARIPRDLHITDIAKTTRQTSRGPPAPKCRSAFRECESSRRQPQQLPAGAADARGCIQRPQPLPSCFAVNDPRQPELMGPVQSFSPLMSSHDAARERHADLPWASRSYRGTDDGWCPTTTSGSHTRSSDEALACVSLPCWT